MASTLPAYANNAQLPNEIHDQIIDHLWDDLPTLKACSLVCRSWLPAARTHLFDTLDARSSGEALQNYRRRLEQHSNVCAYVLTLIASDLDAACLLLTILNNTVHLQLAPPNRGGMYLSDEVGDWERDGQGRKFDMIKTVQIKQWTVDRLRIQTLLFLFPNISAVVLRQIRISTSEPNLPISMNSLRPIPELSIMSSLNSATAWLLRALSFERITSLEVTIVNVTNTRLACTLLSRAGHLPRELTISLSPIRVQASEIAPIFSQLQLPSDMQIRSLCLNCTFWYTDLKVSAEDDLILLLSSKFSSPSLDRIEIIFSMRPAIFDDGTAANWSDIDRLLARMARDTALSEVIVRIDCDEGMADHNRNQRQELDMIASRLPELCAAGIRVGIKYRNLFFSFERWFHGG